MLKIIIIYNEVDYAENDLNAFIKFIIYDKTSKIKCSFLILRFMKLIFYFENIDLKLPKKCNLF